MRFSFDRYWANGPDPPACLLLPRVVLHFSSSTFRWIPVSRTFWVMLKISTSWWSSLSLFQSLTQTLCIYHHTTNCPIPYSSYCHENVTRSMKYKHVLNFYCWPKPLLLYGLMALLSYIITINTPPSFLLFGGPAWRLMYVNIITVSFSPTIYC